MNLIIESKGIVEDKLNIEGDYQFNAINSKNFFQSNWHKNKLFCLEHLINFDKKIEILDIGTGSGNFELRFANKVKKIVGIDYNQKAIEFLREKIKDKKIKNVELICADVRKLSHLDNIGKFDLIFMVDVIEHIKFEDITPLIKNLKKLLKKNGKIIIITPNYRSPYSLIEKISDKLKLVPNLNDQHLSNFWSSNLVKIFENNGFKVEKICSFNLISFLLPQRKFCERICEFEIYSNINFGNLLFGTFSYSE